MYGWDFKSISPSFLDGSFFDNRRDAKSAGVQKICKHLRKMDVCHFDHLSFFAASSRNFAVSVFLYSPHSISSLFASRNAAFCCSS